MITFSDALKNNNRRLESFVRDIRNTGYGDKIVSCSGVIINRNILFNNPTKNELLNEIQTAKDENAKKWTDSCHGWISYLNSGMNYADFAEKPVKCAYCQAAFSDYVRRFLTISKDIYTTEVKWNAASCLYELINLKEKNVEQEPRKIIANDSSFWEYNSLEYNSYAQVATKKTK